MKLTIAWIGKSKSNSNSNSKDSAIQSLADEYLKRLSRYAETKGIALKDEAALTAHANPKNQTRPVLVLLDSRGQQLSSEELAQFIRDHQQRSSQPLLFAIGGADGFTDQTRRAANFTLSLGKMTLAHELARVVLLEQLYRAFTILARHPYHLGHA
ncbi:MAG TPA: 23S rRNA (pseudouridine(1915)-N(3))-methyltransferase RlmH [Terriglobales bacterium]